MKDLVAIAEQIAAKLIERRADHRGSRNLDRGLISARPARGAPARRLISSAERWSIPARAADSDGHPRRRMKGIRSASEPYAKLLASQMRTRFATDWACPKPAPPARPATAYGDAAGHSCIGIQVSKPSAMTLETGSTDRLANMQVFASTALNFLLQNLSR